MMAVGPDVCLVIDPILEDGTVDSVVRTGIAFKREGGALRQLCRARIDRTTDKVIDAEAKGERGNAALGYLLACMRAEPS